MLISDHDRSVVLIVTTAAAVVSLLAALVLSTALVRWSRSLRDDVRRVGDGGVGRRRAARTGRVPGAVEPSSTAAHHRLAEAREREQRLEESRRELVSWVSHDLRTPLAGIRVMAEALEDSIATDPAALPPPDPRRGRPDGRDGRRPLRALPHPRRPARRRAAARRASATWSARPSPPPTRSPGRASVSPRAARCRTACRSRPTRPGSRRVLANLIVNGIRHTPADGTVHVERPTGRRRGRAGRDRRVRRDHRGGARRGVFDVGYRGTSARTPDNPLAGRAHARAPGWAWRSSRASSRRTAARSRWTTSDGRRPRPALGCRFRVVAPERLRSARPRRLSRAARSARR